MCFLINNAISPLFFSLSLPHQLNSAAAECVFSSFLSRPVPAGNKREYIFHLKLRLFQQLRQENVIFLVCGVPFFAFLEFHASRSACVREWHIVLLYPHLTHQINLVGNEFEFFIPDSLQTFCALNEWNWIMLHTQGYTHKFPHTFRSQEEQIFNSQLTAFALQNKFKAWGEWIFASSDFYKTSYSQEHGRIFVSYMAWPYFV